MIRKHWKIIFIFLAQLSDTLAIVAMRIVVQILFRGHVEFGNPRFLFPLVSFSVVFVIVSTMFGLYRGSFHLSYRLQNLIMFRAYLVSILIANTLILFSGLYYFRLSLALFFCSIPIALVISHYLLMRLNLYFQKRGYGIHETLIVGKNGEFQKLFSRFAIFPELGYNVRGYMSMNGKIPEIEFPQYSFDTIHDVTKKYSVDRIFVTADFFRTPEMKTIETISRERKIKVKIISQDTEKVLDIAKIYDIAGITLFTPPQFKVNFVKQGLKRIFDIIGGTIILIMFLPIFVVTAAAIYLETGGPIFFLQKRTSIKGKQPFGFIKFRSMKSNAEQLKSELFDQNDSDGALFKMKNDPRITKVGKFIRKVSIDELPQLFNVIKGDMSLVGPRPLPLTDFEKANESEEFWNSIKERGSVKPGMTGLWQISGRSDVKFREMILLDLYYVENYSIFFDIEILFETIPVVLFGRGAY